MISVKNLSKKFGNTHAIHDVSFEIQTGQIVGFLGPNGAGKTTTMRLLTGYLSPDKGKIRIEGKDPNSESMEAQKLIGYMPESNPLYKGMLVGEFLDTSAKLKQISKEDRESAIDFSVKAVDIASVYYTPIGALSKGFKQRVGLAAALLSEPKVLLLDEPTEGLDPNQRTEVRSLIKELAKERTIIMSTHVMQEAQAISDRILIINEGKIVADGTAKELSQSVEEKIIQVDIEGVHVLKTLKELKNIQDIIVESDKDDRLQAQILAGTSVEVQPIISRLASENKWVIWKIVEQERQLEDVFRQLTK